jgi:hypothetical protein
VGSQFSKTSNSVDELRELFNGAGLIPPPIPSELSPNLKKCDEWCFSSRQVNVWPYEFDDYVKEARSKKLSDYLLVCHAGHGVNSYAIHYYLIRGPLRIFLQLAWGGAYMDKKKTTADVNDSFNLVKEPLNAVEMQKQGKRTSETLIAASDFYGSHWVESGIKQKEMDNKSPKRAINNCVESEELSKRYKEKLARSDER